MQRTTQKNNNNNKKKLLEKVANENVAVVLAKK